MSRFLATVLRKASKPKYSVKNSKAFIRLIRKKNITIDNVLVSFDETICFGSIPVELALDIIDQDFDLIARHTSIDKEDFLKMLRICLQHGNYFVFEKFYKQNLGMFMGSSLAPILVERVRISRPDWNRISRPLMWTIISHPSRKKGFKYWPTSWIRFIPKCSSQWKLKTTKPNPSISSTQHHNQKLITKWYFKEIASNRIMNYHSSHPKNMINNVAKSFIRRVLSLTYKTFQNECIETAKTILEKNSFPMQTIDTLIQAVRNMSNARSSSTDPSYAFMDQSTLNQQRLSTTSSSTQWNRKCHSTGQLNNDPIATEKEKKIFVGITYIPQLTEVVCKQIKKQIPNLCAAPRPPNKVSSLFTDMKQKLRTGQNSMVVYDIPCKGCHQQKGYLGETSWNLEDRCGTCGHGRDLKNDFDNKRILKKVRNKGILKINETNQIVLHEGYAVNFKKDAEHVTPMTTF